MQAISVLTTKDIAERLGVSPARVRQLVQKGALTPLEIQARDHLFSAESLEQYVQTGRRAPGRPRKS